MNRARRFINPASYSSLALLGTYLAIFQDVVPNIMSEFNIGAGKMGLLISAHFLGSLLLPLMLGELGDRIGAKKVLALGYMILIAGLLMILISGSVILFFMSILLTGGGFSVVEGILSGLLVAENPARENYVINISQMFFCVGAASGPLLNLAMRAGSFSWRSAYLVLLCLFAVFLIFVLFIDLPTPKSNDIRGLRIGKLLRCKTFIFLLISMFLYVGVEEGVAFWMSSFTGSADISSFSGFSYLSAYWLGMATGRLVYSKTKNPTFNKIIVWIASSTIFFAGFIFLKQIYFLYGCIFAIGFGFSPAWPGIMMVASKRFRESNNTSMGAMMTVGAAGGFIMPLLLGHITAASNIKTAFIVMLFTLPILIASMYFVSQEKVE